MPPKPLVQSESRRRNVIAVVMLSVFVSSLAMSFALVEHRKTWWVAPTLSPAAVGAAVFALPDQWQEAAPPRHMQWLQSVHLLSDSARVQRQVMVAAVPLQDAWQPELLMGMLRKILITDRNMPPFVPVHSEPFRLANSTGLVATATTMRNQVLIQHVIAIYTPDGRHYWCVHVTETLRPGSRPTVQLINYQLDLVNAICQSASFTPPQPQPDDSETHADEP